MVMRSIMSFPISKISDCFDKINCMSTVVESNFIVLFDI